MSLAGLMLNLLIVVLLLVTIGYCWMLNRRIRVIQDSKSELAQLMTHFDASTERAAESIVALQTASKKIGENIQARIDKANFVLDDLAFMIEKAGKIADQMEAGFAVDRARQRVMASPPEAAAPAEPPPPPPKPPAQAKERTAASLEALLERIVSRKAAAPGREREAGGKARSRSEQELLNMLRAGIKG